MTVIKGIAENDFIIIDEVNKQLVTEVRKDQNYSYPDNLIRVDSDKDTFLEENEEYYKQDPLLEIFK